MALRWEDCLPDRIVVDERVYDNEFVGNTRLMLFGARSSGAIRREWNHSPFHLASDHRSITCLPRSSSSLRIYFH